MALYVPASRRRRRTILVGVVGLVAGLLIGLLVGRSLGSSVDDEVRTAQSDTAQLIARLDALGLEYDQTAAAGASGSDARRGSIDAARAIQRDAPALLTGMPWVPSDERDAVLAAVGDVVAGVEDGASSDEVGAAIDRAEAILRAAAGLPAASP